MPKFDEIKLLFSNAKPSPDIFGFCETFLTDEILDNELVINNYTFERKDRLSGKGGGVIVYIADRIPYLRRKDLESDSIESLWIQINFKNSKPFLVGNIYRPPRSNKKWMKQFDMQLKGVVSQNLETHFLGDFNFHYLIKDPNGNHFQNRAWGNTIHKHGFSQIIDTPTRITNQTSSLIDHIYTNTRDVIIDHQVPTYTISDHLPVCCTRYTGKMAKHHGHDMITYRSYKHFSEEKFLSDISMIDFRVIESQYDVNRSLSLFHDLMHYALSHNAPLKQKRVKKSFQPSWFNEQIKRSIHDRNMFFKKKDFLNYKLARNRTTSLIRKAKINFFNKAIAENQSISYFWQQLKHLDSQTAKQRLPEMIEYNEEVLTDKTEIANAFNKHFTNVANLIDRSDPCPKYLSDLKKSLDERIQDHYLDIKHITTLEVKQILNKLNINKATGLDGIGPKILKLCSDYIAEAITFLINKSISEGIFPNDLKCASVIPVYKSGPKTNPNNYRPISILPTLSKVFERHIASQIQHFLSRHDLIYSHQSGFRKNHSCCTSLVSLIDGWLKDVDEGKCVGAVFLDLKKAFDLVDHNILIEKLKAYHFSSSSISIMKSYLDNRYQLVKYNDVQSKLLPVQTGVPQGSIIGPLLFVIYINDISSIIHPHSNIDLYADDSTIHKSDNNVQNIQNCLQQSIDKVSGWCKFNNMAINPVKSKCMLIGTNRRIKNTSLKLLVDQCELENVTCQKILGVYVDHNLKWNKQYNYVCKKLNMKINLLKRLTPYLTIEMKMIFYNSYILSQFDYCCTVWANGNKTCSSKLNKIQKRAARIILQKSYDTPSLKLFSKLEWLTFENRCKYHSGVMVYKALNNLTPIHISNMFTSLSSSSTRSLRSAINGNIATTYKIPRTNYLLHTFSSRGKDTWNSIPIHIKHKDSLRSFKISYKDYLFQVQSGDIIN